MKKKPIYSNIFLTLIALLFIVLYTVKCSKEPEPQQNNTEILTIKHKNDSLVRLNLQLNKRVDKLLDSIYKFHIGILKPDKESGFFHVNAESDSSNCYTVIKLSSKTFSIVEAEDILQKRYGYRNNKFHIVSFEPITEYCYLQYYNKYLRKYEKK